MLWMVTAWDACTLGRSSCVFVCMQVWPGMSVYPDYLAAPNITKWLTKQVKRFYDQVPFDGMWLDMCEPSNFCTGMNCKPDPDNATQMHCKFLEMCLGPLKYANVDNCHNEYEWRFCWPCNTKL